MEIIDKKNGLDARACYALTHCPTTRKAVDLAGQTVTVLDWILVDDVELKTGEQKRVLTFHVNEDPTEIYGTISQTFIKQFTEMVEFFGDVDTIRIKTATSKSGREYLTCEIA